MRRGGTRSRRMRGGATDGAAAKCDPKTTKCPEDEKAAAGGTKEGFGSMAGGRRRRRTHRRKSHRRRARKTHRRRHSRRRGGMGRKTLTKAILPFGLWGVQRLMRRKKNRRTMKRVGKKVSRTLSL